MAKQRNPLKSSASKAARERYLQAMVDADIEGLARAREAERLVAGMRREDLTVEERIARLKAYFSKKKPRADAAE